MKGVQRAKSAKKTAGSLPRGLTLELARTWLITVINPVVQGIRREKVWLAEKNWTWRYSTGGFEYLWPIATYVDPSYRDNLTEFCRWYPEAAEAIERHDSLLPQLATACREHLERLLDSGDFRRSLEHANAAARNQGINPKEARGAVSGEEWPRLIAQYLINNVGALPEYYTTMAYWKTARPIVVGTRKSQGLREQFESLERLGGKLLRAANQAEQSFTSVRQGYTAQFGLPPIPLPS